MYAQVIVAERLPAPEGRYSDTVEACGSQSAAELPRRFQFSVAGAPCGGCRRSTRTPRHPLTEVNATTGDVRDGRDARHMAHNPEVAGSNPAPATSFHRSRPFL